MILDQLEELNHNLKLQQEENNYFTQPLFFRLQNGEEDSDFSSFLKKHPTIKIFDELTSQLEELVKVRNPAKSYDGVGLREMCNKYLNNCPEWAYGVWVYYPWNNHLIHLLDEKEFIELRTSRNLYKITEEERQLLATKKIGVIGLSVGQSVALTLAMERSFGELRIADFDTLELSNMNRLRTGLHHLGVPKTVIAAREIAEIDPFLKVNCFHEGVTKENIDNFVHGDGSLDLLIDECDSLNVKILCRKIARQAGIPVLMDTSDRGMIDIERFDLESERPIFHGLIEEDMPENQLQDPNLRVKLSQEIIGLENLSERMKISLTEIGKSISTWPQLASAVAAGGAVTAEISRKLFCGESIPSGRYYIDSSKIIKSKNRLQ